MNRLVFGLVMLGLLVMGLMSTDGLVLASEREGDKPREGLNAVREDFCAARLASNTVCGGFCFWTQCNECPQCCASNCDCDISGEGACVSKGEYPSCGVEVEYEDCSTDEDGNEDCTTYTVCESCGVVDCATGCCGWYWHMFRQPTDYGANLYRRRSRGA